ncbi:hypothetical protein A1O1_01955 [Capronia coronata CBS 617.96]|uniref:Uncharacterized protein n=1 Tax=Capronia coronata CBS 617.96 TaxID=1182541 RepID=W9YLX6_9EURO|nr:uncharacterized protein A1O1_01955 [Capronia coronata CBS 617.96]EXJ93563.1 hypothetical protein A1O1_01955 [Capronia coronata CBS 617.96]
MDRIEVTSLLALGQQYTAITIDKAEYDDGDEISSTTSSEEEDYDDDGTPEPDTDDDDPWDDTNEDEDEERDYERHQTLHIVLDHVDEGRETSRVLHRPRSSRQQEELPATARKAPCRYICVVVEDSDEDGILIQQPRRRLPNRFPRTTTTTTTSTITACRACIRGSRQAQGAAAVIDVNSCMNACMRFPLTDISCLKCDMHAFVYCFVSCLHLCQIVWEDIPVAERPDNWDLVDATAQEPRRMCGWTWWWRYVEDRSTGELYSWRAVKKGWRGVNRLRGSQ